MLEILIHSLIRISIFPRDKLICIFIFHFSKIHFQSLLIPDKNCISEEKLRRTCDKDCSQRIGAQCKSEVQENILWPRTKANDMSRVPCPGVQPTIFDQGFANETFYMRTWTLQLAYVFLLSSPLSLLCSKCNSVLQRHRRSGGEMGTSKRDNMYFRILGFRHVDGKKDGRLGKRILFIH